MIFFITTSFLLSMAALFVAVNSSTNQRKVTVFESRVEDIEKQIGGKRRPHIFLEGDYTEFPILSVSKKLEILESDIKALATYLKVERTIELEKERTIVYKKNKHHG